MRRAGKQEMYDESDPELKITFSVQMGLWKPLNERSKIAEQLQGIRVSPVGSTTRHSVNKSIIEWNVTERVAFRAHTFFSHRSTTKNMTFPRKRPASV